MSRDTSQQQRDFMSIFICQLMAISDNGIYHTYLVGFHLTIFGVIWMAVPDSSQGLRSAGMCVSAYGYHSCSTLAR